MNPMSLPSDSGIPVAGDATLAYAFLSLSLHESIVACQRDRKICLHSTAKPVSQIVAQLVRGQHRLS